MRPERVGDVTDGVGESPVWDVATSSVWSVDITGRAIRNRSLATGETKSWPTIDLPTAIMPAEGGFAVTFARGVAIWRNGELVQVAAPENDPDVRLNEAATDPDGRLWVTSMENNLNPDLTPREQGAARGRLFRLERGKLTVMLGPEFGIPNTLVWSPDGRRMYFGDSARNRIWVCAFSVDGEMSDRRVFVDGGPGVPDGSAIDDDGCLWTARFGAGRVLRYAPDGKVDREIRVPCRNPTATAFGGSDGRSLIVTSARFLIEDPTRHDGAMFALRAGIGGPEPAPYVGS